jgi:hypothetical protein
MKNSGIAGSGTVAVLASQPKKMTSIHENIAGGRFSSCASAIELNGFRGQYFQSTRMLQADCLRETQLSNDAWLIKGQTGRPDSIEAPDSKEQPEPVILECVLELLPIKVFV